jgi:hypothetical protein
MPATSQATAPQKYVLDGYEGAFDALPGGYTVAFEHHTADADAAPLFRGLPDDCCQCPHWGVVLEGRITFRFAGHDETFEAGDAYYAPPGHTPVFSAGCRLVEFSPTDALAETIAVVESNLAGA